MPFYFKQIRYVLVKFQDRGFLMDNKQILIVDDEKALRKLFQTALSQKGYRVISAESSEEALEILKTKKIYVMFLDLNLPGMSGIDLCKKILKKQPETVAYAVTGYTSSFNSAECKQAGFKKYFSKPVSLQVLFKAAQEAFKQLAT